MSKQIWIDHLEDLARVARSFEDFLTEVNKAPENHSDLFFTIPEVTIMRGDEPTGWSLVVEDGAVCLRIEEADDDR